MKKKRAREKQESLGFPQRLTERYQPQSPDAFIGIEKARRVMAKFLEAPRPMAFLFVGASGTGKTAMAQAVARALEAEVHHIASQQCTIEAVQSVITRCHYVPMFGASGWHVIHVDEADRMSNAAQLALLSPLDSTGPVPRTIFLFTANQTGSLERRFLSRCVVLEFGKVNGEIPALLRRVWSHEAPEDVLPPDFNLIANDAAGNVRDALNKLEVELLAA